MSEEKSRRKECDALCSDVERDRDEYESTINRVRAVLETEAVLNRTALEYRGLVCKAVYGADDASS